MAANESVSGHTLARAAAHYARRFDSIPLEVASAPLDNLRLIVTIPAYDEPDLEGTLRSLAQCHAPAGDASVEVLVLVNAPENASAAVKERNEQTFARARDLAVTLTSPWLRIFVSLDNNLPEAHAGVGLARKTLMDAALKRLAGVRTTSERPRVIAAFDADCICERSYLATVLQVFERSPRLAGASIHFEHDLTDALTHDAIVHYELYLRTYRLGLHYAGSPYAHHTVGSSMAVNALDYAKLGGMNRRQAGEDFYFLQKFMGTGRFKAVADTCVRPAARVSARVPFGTGAAIRKALHENTRMSFYDVRVYDDLKVFYDHADGWWHGATEEWQRVSPALAAFLTQQAFAKRLAQIERNTANAGAAAQHVRAWMNGFRVMKFARFACQQHYGYAEPQAAVLDLLDRLGEPVTDAFATPAQQLAVLRQLDRTR